MSWMGKIFGGSVGFMLGGPLGLIIGGMLGHHTIDKGSAGISRLESRQAVFFTATFALLGKLSKADGQVSAAEITLVERVMRDNLRLDDRSRQIAIKIFNQAKDSDAEFMDYAHQFYQEFSGQQQMLTMLLELLLLLAYADGELHPAEEAMLQDIAQLFHSESIYHRLKEKYADETIPLDAHYETLGCRKGDSIQTVKKKYRKLAMEYHPDRIQSQGLPPELAAAAESKFKDIQNAYDEVEKHVGSRH